MWMQNLYFRLLGMRGSLTVSPVLAVTLLTALLVACVVSADTTHDGQEGPPAIDPHVLEFARALGIEADDGLTLGSTTTPELVASYDLNENGMIDRSEVIQAVGDYFADEISRGDVIGIIGFYLSGEQVGSGPATEPPQISDMIGRVRPAIVKVLRPSGGQGSGVIFKVDASYAYVLTNQHVTGYDSTATVLVDDVTEHTGTVLGVDVDRDLAVVRIGCPLCSYIDFGDSNTLNLGDDVMALGYPRDSYLPRADVDAAGNRIILPGSMTVTKGIVSAFRYDTENDRQLVQTDTPLNPGNSGGPLLSLDGEIVGINTFGIIASENLNFAVLETTVQEQLPTLLAGTPTAEPDIPRERQNEWFTVLGPVSGHIHHNDDNRFELVSWDIDLRDMGAFAWFRNPYAHSTERKFSYGLMLRSHGTEPYLVFVVSSHGGWRLIERDGADSRTIASGKSTDIRVGDGQFNHLSAGLVDNYAAMGINGELLVSDDGRDVFDVGSNTGFGDVAAITGYFANSEIAGQVTDFRDLYVSAFVGVGVEAALERLGEIGDEPQPTYSEHLDSDEIESEERTP